MISGDILHQSINCVRWPLNDLPKIYAVEQKKARNVLKQQSHTINSLFARYADCVLAQIFQSTACNDYVRDHFKIVLSGVYPDGKNGS